MLWIVGECWVQLYVDNNFKLADLLNAVSLCTSRIIQCPQFELDIFEKLTLLFLLKSDMVCFYLDGSAKEVAECTQHSCPKEDATKIWAPSTLIFGKKPRVWWISGDIVEQMLCNKSSNGILRSVLSYLPTCWNSSKQVSTFRIELITGV